MKLSMETGATLALAGVLFAGGCSEAPAPEFTPVPTASLTASPEATIGAAICSKELVTEALETEPVLKDFIEEMRGATQEELSQVQRDNFGVLATVSMQAQRISITNGSIEVPNYKQDGLGFEHTVDLDASTIYMAEWNFNETEICQISSANTAVIKPNTETNISISLGDTSYDFKYFPAELRTQMQDGSPLTPEAVGATTLLVYRYFDIVDEAIKQEELLPPLEEELPSSTFDT